MKKTIVRGFSSLQALLLGLITDSFEAGRFLYYQFLAPEHLRYSICNSDTTVLLKDGRAALLVSLTSLIPAGVPCSLSMNPQAEKPVSLKLQVAT
jgi:hypothetical protein